MTLSRNLSALTLCLASAPILLSACRIPVRVTAERRLQEIVPPGRKEATQHVGEAEASKAASQPRDDQRRSAPRPSVPDNRVTALQREARLHNPTVEEWDAKVAAASARSRQAVSRFLPTLRSDGLYLALDDEIAFPNPLGGTIVVQDQEAYTQTTQLRYRVLDWGASHYAYQAALNDEDSIYLSRERSLQGLDLEVARACYELLAAKKDLEVAEASVTTLEGALKLARDLREVGRATDADVLVVEARYERRSFEARRRADTIEALEDVLLKLLHRDLGRSMTVEEPEELPPIAQALVQAEGAETVRVDRFWESVALAHRAELASLDAVHESLLNIRRAETASFAPQVGVFLQHEYSTTDSAFRDPDLFSGGVAAEWEIYSGGRTQARRTELAAQADEVQARYRGLQLEILRSVREAVRRLRRAQDAVGVAAKVVAQAQENLRRLQDQFGQGRSTGQELLEAESLLRTEEARSIAARYTLHLEYAVLRYTCGLNPEQAAEEVVESDDSATTDP